MGVCEKCGNEYDKSFEVTAAGKTHTFDSFECAISMMAPRCEHCDTSVIGHGVEVDGHFFCCANCAEHQGYEGLRDRIGDRVEPIGAAQA